MRRDDSMEEEMVECSSASATAGPIKTVRSATHPNAGEAWTEEEHASFLNRMEESFVRRLLLARSASPAAAAAASQRRGGAGRMEAPPGTEVQTLAPRTHNRRSKKLRHQHSNELDDQVVPHEIQSKMSDDEKNIHEKKKKKKGNI